MVRSLHSHHELIVLPTEQGNRYGSAFWRLCEFRQLHFIQVFGSPKQWHSEWNLLVSQSLWGAWGYRIFSLGSIIVHLQSSGIRTLSPQQAIWQLLSQGLRHNIALETRGGTTECLPADSFSEPEQTALWPAITQERVFEPITAVSSVESQSWLSAFM